MKPETPNIESSEKQEPLPLSLLNDYLYCSRRAALKVVEGWRLANEHTARGDIAHEHSDLPGYEVAKGVKLLRALPVWSERLALSGKCDIVEIHALPSSGFTIGGEETGGAGQGGTTGNTFRSDASHDRDAGDVGTLFPVEFKLGKRRQWENDDAQLCAQALCLEEMFRITIPRGAIFHADSKRRREVEFTRELRASTEKAVAELHALQRAQHSTLKHPIPAAVFKPACEECSLFDICLPKASCADNRVDRLTRDLFKT